MATWHLTRTPGTNTYGNEDGTVVLMLNTGETADELLIDVAPVPPEDTKD